MLFFKKKFKKPTIEQTAWVTENILKSLKDGYSYRGLIYNLMGYGPEAYVTLQLVGLLDINNININLPDEIINELDPIIEDLKAHNGYNRNYYLIKQLEDLKSKVGGI
jgi:hypothetical protein